MSHYSTTGYILTKHEYNYLKPAIPKLVNEMSGRYYLTCDLDDLSDSLDRLKGMYDNWDEIPNKIVKNCYATKSITPFREFMTNLQTEYKIKKFLKPLIERILSESNFDLEIYDDALNVKNRPPQFDRLPPATLTKIETALTKLHYQRERSEDYGRDIPQSYYDGVNALQRYIIKEFKKVGIQCVAEEGDDETITLVF